jgi:hypothetical protein
MSSEQVLATLQKRIIEKIEQAIRGMGPTIQTGWTTLLSSLTLLVELEDTKPEDVTGLA